MNLDIMTSQISQAAAMKKIAVPFLWKSLSGKAVMRTISRKSPGGKRQQDYLYHIFVRSSNWFSKDSAGSMKTNLPIQLEELGAR